MAHHRIGWAAILRHERQLGKKPCDNSPGPIDPQKLRVSIKTARDLPGQRHVDADRQQ